MKAKVSVIVPVYNGKEYIKECINSIQKQTYSNIELIVVNDGSIDNTEEVIMKMQKENKNNMKYIFQENSGVGQARNVGLNNATGEYVIFVDNDDTIKEDYIETLTNIALDTKSDVVCTGIQYMDNDGKNVGNLLLKKEEWCKYSILAAHGKIYKREFLIQNKIFFSKDHFAEDAYFNLQVLLKASHIEIDEYIGYCYRINPKGITRND